MYDVAVIGAGPGGYVCAITAANLGAKVCIIEKNGLGGTCTQRGCIPTKYLHSMGEIIRKAKGAKKYGIDANITLDYTTLKRKMAMTISKLSSGIKLMLEQSGVELFEGEAKITSKNQLLVNDRTIETKNMVIATGSYPVCIRGYEFGGNILSTDSILELESLPKSILIVGGGYTGCEFASILNALGCDVCLVEIKERLMPDHPPDIGNTLEKYMRLDGIKVMLDSTVEKITDDKIIINGEGFVFEKVLVSVGRKPNLNREELERMEIKFNDNGIMVDKRMKTNLENVYAIGDITGTYELAHVASRQGEVVAHNIVGDDEIMDYSAVPFCVFTYPEVAFVGKCDGRSSEIPLVANAKANCLGDTRGFVRVYENDGKIGGAIIVGPHAGELIIEPTLAIQMKLKISDVEKTIHAHPTLPEAFSDAVKGLSYK